MICYAETQKYDRLQKTAAPAPGPGQATGNLASWWRSENSIPTQIQVLLLLYVILVAIQTVFIWWRRCRNNALIKYPLLLAYSVAQPVLAYTLVLLNYSSFKRSEYLLRYIGVVVVMGLGRVNNMIAYHVDDNKRYTTDIFQHALFLFNFVSMFIFLYKINNSSASSNLQLFCILLSLFYGTMNFGRIYASMMASSFSDKGSSHLQEYMKTEHRESTEYDPQTLRGYNYLICSNDDVDATVSEVWMSNEGLFGGSEGTRLKELCLSFALFQLSRRRIFGVACPEAKLPKTHDLIFKGLLLNIEENCLAYRIIETELAFAHDHFFTTSQSLNTNTGKLNILLSIGLVTFLYPFTVIPFMINSFRSSGDIPGGRAGIIIRGVIVLLTFALEVLQIYVHLSSDWVKVERACQSISRNCTLSGITIHRLGHKLRQPFGHWQNKIGQHSLLKDLHSRSVTSFIADVMGSLFYVLQWLLGYVPALPRGIYHPGVKEPDCIPLTNDVKLAIAQALKASNGHLSNGASSLRRNDLDIVSVWACHEEFQATNLLIWHIATEYCDIAQSLQTAEQEGSSMLNHTVTPLPCFKKKQTIAREISNCCAYLMAFVPELLPDHHLETNGWFYWARMEALDLLHEDRSPESKYTKLQNYNEQEKTVFSLGIRLGKMLEEIEDDGRRWNILADLWTEMILYIAPSDNAKDHIQHLANGGEFLTHLWALLTHAGILERDQQNPDQPHEQNINTHNSVDHQEVSESLANHEAGTFPVHLELVPIHNSGSAVPPSRHRTMVDPLPPHWMRRARSWNVYNSPARPAMLDRMMSCFTLQAPPPQGVDNDSLQLLPAPEITTANECRIDAPEASSSKQQTLPEQV